MADAVFGHAGFDEVEPVGVGGLAIFIEGDVAAVAGVETGVEGSDVVVDAGGGATVTDVGVNGVGEVDRGGAFGQVDDVAFGCEDEDAVLEDVDFHRFERVEIFLGAFDGELAVDEIFDPGHFAGIGSGGFFAGLVVLPVGGDTTFGLVVHGLGADLEFDNFAAVAEDGGMQRLIAVGFGLGDVVFDPATHWFPELMDDAEGGVTVADGWDDHTEGDKVVDTDDIAIVFEEFFIKTVEMFDATTDGGKFDVVFLQSGFEFFGDGFDVTFFGADGAFSGFVGPGVFLGKNVFES